MLDDDLGLCKKIAPHSERERGARCLAERLQAYEGDKVTE